MGQIFGNDMANDIVALSTAKGYTDVSVDIYDDGKSLSVYSNTPAGAHRVVCTVSDGLPDFTAKEISSYIDDFVEMRMGAA